MSRSQIVLSMLFLAVALHETRVAAMDIPLGNLLDDAAATSLTTAVASDTFQAQADATDLGVDLIASDLGAASTAITTTGNTFNFTNLGGGSAT